MDSRFIIISEWKGGCKLDEKALKALGDPKRYKLLQLLSEHGYCVSALARRSGLSESTVSQHLKILREADLVYGVKYGYYTHYRINKETLDAIIAQLQQLQSVHRAPCENSFHGCSEAEAIQCKAYESHKRQKEDDLC